MRILLYRDDTLNLDLDALSVGLNLITIPGIGKGQQKFRITGHAVRAAKSYKQLSPELLAEAKTTDLATRP